MKSIVRFLQILYFVYAALLMVVLMVPVFLFAVCASFAGVIRGGNLIGKACMLWTDIWFPMVGIRHRNHFEQPLKKGTAYLYVANHTSYLDAGLCWKIFRKPIRPLGKAEMGRVPVFGFIYRNAVVLVDRSSAANRSRSVLRLKSVLRKGISILVFPEGTFNETHQPLSPFFDGAFRIAIETGTPIKPVLILDAYDRFPYQVPIYRALNPGISRAVFLEEIPVEGLSLKDAKALRDQVYAVMERKLREYKASWIRESFN